MAETVQIDPQDAYNQELVANVHPSDWPEPDPARSYNLVVIGAGTAGLVTAIGAAGLGARVALVEKHLMGGDCLNVGCVPSKAVIRSSRTVAEIMRAEHYGVHLTGDAEVDFARVMARMRRLRARISHHDSAQRYCDQGVDVFLGEGRFGGRESLEVNGKTLRFKKAVIATGTRAAQPPIEGLDRIGYLTNETVFSLTERPPKLAVIGAGPIGCEMAQTFQRLGSEVILFHKYPRILNREDPDASELLRSIFENEGVHLALESKPVRVFRENGRKAIEYERDGETETVVVDEILVAVGRTPNVERLNLEAAGVEYDGRDGVVVDDRLRTSNPRIYAAGDVAMRYKFTHAADAAARIVIQNALFFGRKKLSALTIPWCTYTEPEVAHVGLNEEDARRQGIDVATFVRELRNVDRAVTDGEEQGFVKVHVRKGSDKILGATIVAHDAGNMISEVTLAMVGKVGLGTIAGVIHPYPTTAEAIKQTGDAYNRTRLTPFVKKLFGAWLAWRR